MQLKCEVRERKIAEIVSKTSINIKNLSSFILKLLAHDKKISFGTLNINLKLTFLPIVANGHIDNQRHSQNSDFFHCLAAKPL